MLEVSQDVDCAFVLYLLQHAVYDYVCACSAHSSTAGHRERGGLIKMTSHFATKQRVAHFQTPCWKRCRNGKPCTTGKYITETDISHASLYSHKIVPAVNENGACARCACHCRSRDEFEDWKCIFRYAHVWPLCVMVLDHQPLILPPLLTLRETIQRSKCRV